MSLDTKYRPLVYDDVLGQKNTIKILRQLVIQDRGFQQSVLFAGRHGGGKTTLGRIYARALLCAQTTPEGDPCDECISCRAILDVGSSDAFIEVDAATNSGKDDVRKILAEIEYTSFSGRRRIYLFDESHQLSASALDALLKPLEENLPGSRDKRLVCIFCTTEPEKMRATILSRCAPAFVIRVLSPTTIAGRLEHICKAEGFEYDPEVLPLLAEMHECHVRDSIKALEGVSMLGSINRENVTSYLHLDLHTVYLDILDRVGKVQGDPAEILRAAQGVMGRVSPGVCYKRLCEAALLAYQAHLGVIQVPSYWDVAKVKALGGERSDTLLVIAERLSRVPARPTSSMVLCDLSTLHLQLQGRALLPQARSTAVPSISGGFSDSSIEKSPPSGTVGGAPYVDNGVYRDPRGVRRLTAPPQPKDDPDSVDLDLQDFARFLGKGVAELGKAGPT